MKLLRQFSIILLILFTGEVLHKFLNLPVPGNVLGMIILLILLCTGALKLEAIEEISDFLLNHLAFFFVPAGVGLMTCFGILKGKWLAIIGVCLLSTILIMGCTGRLVQFLKGRMTK